MTTSTASRRSATTLIVVLGLAFLVSGCGLMAWIGEVVAATDLPLPYAIVDTGQIIFYGNEQAIAEPSVEAPFYGQDAQIDGNWPQYIDHGDGTVTDRVTGLMWQQSVPDKMTYAEAVAAAEGFVLAGHTDWRLPTIKELYSLIDFSGLDLGPESGSGSTPFIDTDVFDFRYGDMRAGERIIDAQWATSTTYVAGNLMFGVNFADGRIKGYGLTLPGRGEKTFFVRHVRGNPGYGENDLLPHGDGTISDLATGLMWSQTDSGAGMDWEDALDSVQELNRQGYLGYSDWRLPNAKELQSIVDYSRSPDTTGSAAIDPLFDCTTLINEAGQQDWGFYWTSTTHASQRGGQSAVYVAFGRSLGYMNGRWIDVHGAGSQRSDPKAGDPSQYPTGHGPQGDAIRILNYVRVVRDIAG